MTHSRVSSPRPGGGESFPTKVWAYAVLLPPLLHLPRDPSSLPGTWAKEKPVWRASSPRTSYTSLHGELGPASGCSLARRGSLSGSQHSEPTLAGVLPCRAPSPCYLAAGARWREGLRLAPPQRMKPARLSPGVRGSSLVPSLHLLPGRTHHGVVHQVLPGRAGLVVEDDVKAVVDEVACGMRERVLRGAVWLAHRHLLR